MLALGGVLVSLAILAAATAASWAAHRHALAEASRELRNMSFVLADHTDRALQAVELALTSAIERARSDGALVSVESFDAWTHADRVHRMLHERADALPQVDALVLVDHRGRVSGSSRFMPAPPNDLSDREYFHALRDGFDRFIGPPVENRGTGTWAFHVARRVETEDGAFLGVIVGVIELAYFEKLYAALSLGEHSSVSLFRSDGVLLVRSPVLPAAIGRDHSHLEQLSLAGRAPDGSVSRVLGLDETERLISARSLEWYPLRIHVGFAVDTVLQGWRTALIQTAAGVIALLCLVVASVVGAIRAIRAEAQAAEATLAFEREAALEKLHHQQELAAKDAEFKVVVQGMSQGVWMFNASGRLSLTNRRAANLLGVPEQALSRGATLDELVGAAAAAGAITAVVALLRLSRIAAHRAPDAFDQRLTGDRVASIVYQPLPDGGWLATFEDISDRHAAEARVRYLAEHDELTGIANRSRLMNRLSEMLREAATASGVRGEARCVAVLYLDLDLFKEVNDTLGHPIGDALLRDVATRIERTARLDGGSDTLVARIGGDEFVVIRDTGRSDAAVVRAEVEAMAIRLVEALFQPFLIEGYRIMIGTTVGVALHPQDGATAEALVRAADLALYRGKQEGRGRHWFFERAMEVDMQTRLSLETDLRQALLQGDGRDFELHFQPVVDIATRQPTGFEALVRWRRAGHEGLVGPAQFIPIAEETGLISVLDAFVLRRACAEAAAWPDAALRVAVNVSPVNLRAAGFVELVTEALAASGLPASRLELEITEGMLIRETEHVLTVMHALRALGVGFAMDDFGTGYSALSYLRSFPFERVKIDRSFIGDVEKSRKDASIVRAVAQLCLDLDMTAVIEGVETESQLALARQAGCLEAQGYLFSHPVPAGDVPATVAALRRAFGNPPVAA